MPKCESIERPNDHVSTLPGPVQVRGPRARLHWFQDELYLSTDLGAAPRGFQDKMPHVGAGCWVHPQRWSGLSPP